MIYGLLKLIASLAVFVIIVQVIIKILTWLFFSDGGLNQGEALTGLLL